MTVGHWKAKFSAEQHCRMCHRPSSVRRLTKHHLVPQRWFVREDNARYRWLMNSPANLVPLCDPCHITVECRDDEGRRHLRRCLSQTEIAQIIRLRGLAWLDGRYPRHPVRALDSVR
jgi:hypothetical protein